MHFLTLNIYHPDLSSNDQDFIKIHNAYKTLSDPTARAVYDMSLEACRSLCRFQFPFRVLSEDGIVAEIFTGSLARNLIVGVLNIFESFVG
ncbi:hypothetical protein WN943_023207 [Citrus x changshan-huyou]